LIIIFSIVAAGCASATPAPTVQPAAKTYKLAAVFPGVITDADYNTLAYVGLTAVKSDLGVETAFSESVPVPDVDRVMREYIDAGYNMIWTHGGQFVNQTVDLARAFPDLIFIAEGDAPVESPPANLWFIDRNFHTGFYAIGATAAKATKTGKIGYIGGQTLPFSYAEVHAVQQALKDLGSSAELKTVWVGDFNDPTKARQVADAMMGEGVDVIMGSLNLGMFGVFEAVKANPNKVLVTAKYTDKTSFAPDNYITSLLYDFAGPLKEIVTRTQKGETGGYYPLGFDTGVAIQLPLRNVDESVMNEVKTITGDIISGKIQVVKDITPIQ
ncbi:MAG: BMP family protein, partial [Acidobacteriaceae bacterium]